VVYRIEADVPSPLRSCDRQTRLDRDRADMNITIVDVPAIGTFGVRAAGEGGHGPLKRGGRRAANFQSLVIGKAHELQRLVVWKTQRRFALTVVAPWRGLPPVCRDSGSAICRRIPR
jgi:hypothetical protein